MEEGTSRRRDALDRSSVVVVVGEVGEERDSRSDWRVASCFRSRAASSAATRDAMCSSRAWAREALVWMVGFSMDIYCISGGGNRLPSRHCSVQCAAS